MKKKINKALLAALSDEIDKRYEANPIPGLMTESESREKDEELMAKTIIKTEG